MSRPGGWDVVGYASDPVPGDRFDVSRLAREYTTISETARDAADMLRRVQGADLSKIWSSDAADSFVDKIDDMPSDLDKVIASYSGVGDTLKSWSQTIDDTQFRADNALEQAKTAHTDLMSAQSRLDDASADYDTYNSSYTQAKTSYEAHKDDEQPPAGVPTEAKVKAAADNRAVAASRVSDAKADISAAQSRIQAAKKLVDEAHDDWTDGENRTEKDITAAGDAGLGKEHWWDAVFQSDAWDVFITICKVFVAIAGIIVLIIGGPLAWVVFAAALLILADTLYEMSQGRAGWQDVVFALLDCIPGSKGITTVGRLLSMAGDAKKAMTGVKDLASLGHLAGTTLTAITKNGARYGAMLLKEPVLAAKQFASNPGARIQRMVMETVHLKPVGSVKSSLSGFADAFGSSRGAGDSFASSLAAGLKKGEGDFFATQRSGYDAYVQKVGETNPARASQLWQGGDGYYGVDRMTNMPAGSAPSSSASVGYPGQHVNYAVPGVPGGTSADFHAGAQVGPNPGYAHPYREQHAQVVFDSGRPYAEGTAMANPQFGPGNAKQYFQPDMGTSPSTTAFNGGTPSAIPFPDDGFPLHNYDVRTVNESIGMRHLMWAPVRTYGYLEPATR